MPDESKNPNSNDESSNGLPRREFVMSVAAGLAAAGSAAAKDVEVVETDVEIKMPDGTCDAAFIHPKSGSHPGVLIWTDAFGLRPLIDFMVSIPSAGSMALMRTAPGAPSFSVVRLNIQWFP
jgi:carboxymethylenebutenolidase